MGANRQNKAINQPINQLTNQILKYSTHENQMTTTMKKIPTVNEALYDHYAWVRPDESCAGPFRYRIQAVHEQENNGGGGYLIRCSSIGVLLSDRQPDGTYLDLGDVKNPNFPRYISSTLPTDEEKPYVSTHVIVMVPAPEPAAEPSPPAKTEEEFTPEQLEAALSGEITYTQDAKEGEISEEAKERIKRSEEHMKSFGFKLARLPLAPGSVMHVDTAKMAFRVQHAEHATMPELATVLTGIRDQVRSEARVDVAVQAATLRMQNDGRIYRINGPRDAAGKPRTLAFEENGIRQLCSRLPSFFPRAADFLLALEPEVRATTFNAQAARIPAGTELLLRTRLDESKERGIFSAVGRSYSSFDADAIADTLLPAFRELDQFSCAGTTRGTGVYRPDDSSIQVNALWHADTVVDAAVGDVFKVGLRFRSSDTGGGSIKGDLVVWRNACLNYIVLSRSGP